MLKYLAVLALTLCFTAMADGQGRLKAVIKDARTQQPLPGATALLTGTTTGSAADSAGLLVLEHIPEGSQIIEFRYVGHLTRRDTLTFPLAADTVHTLFLQPEGGEGKELEGVVVSATRSNRTLANIPTRIEVISGEELDEKGNMKPGDIRMLLAESTGIQTQQTSATSASSSIRIQGLDGRYTQLIRDGFPLYAGFSGGLGLLQIAPLDLRRVEVIKGSASTLYGGGAIAGLVNLVSKVPTSERQLDLLINGTSALGLDVSAFYAQKFTKVGTTVYAAYNHGSAYDPSGIGFTAIPEFNRYTLNPKLFFYLNGRTQLSVGLNSTAEDRLGGDIRYVEGHGDAEHSYFERNRTGRYSTQAELTHQLNDNEQLIFRNSVSYFDRTISLPDYRFSGVQLSTYSEADYVRTGRRADWVAGLNFLTDQFREKAESTFPLRDYTYTTWGGFVQNTLNITKQVQLESGLRGDYHNRYGFLLLPRLSALWKISPHLTSRLGGGLGYKAPTVFTEEAERIQFRNVLPVDVAGTRAERSYGANFDVTYRTGLFDNRVSLSINQLLFYTRVSHPILLTPLSSGDLQFEQSDGNLNTKGLETNVKLTYMDFQLYLGYTLADVHQQQGGITSRYPLVSRNRLNNVLVYEVEDKLKVGLEAYYYSPQLLNDGTSGRGYWTAGLMAEKIFHRFSLFVNFENLTDTRQTKFDAIYTGSLTQPVFRDIYAPLDGFVVNGGIKLKL